MGLAGDGGAAALQLSSGGDDHVFIELYADDAAPSTRSAYIGYPSAGSDVLTITNEFGSLTTIDDATLRATGALDIQGNTTLGNANSDTLTINAGSDGSGISFGDASFQNCVLETNGSGVVTCGTDATGSGELL